jgi:hypothetical protein
MPVLGRRSGQRAHNQRCTRSASNLPATPPRIASRCRWWPLRPRLSTCGVVLWRPATPGGRCGGRSLHTAEATGSKPVTPTSTNAFLGPRCDASSQQIASKPPTVVAIALNALSHFGVCGLPCPLGRESGRRSGQVGFEPGPMLLRPASGSGGWPVSCDFDSAVVTAGAHQGPAVPDAAVRTQRGPAWFLGVLAWLATDALSQPGWLRVGSRAWKQRRLDPAAVEPVDRPLVGEAR